MLWSLLINSFVKYITYTMSIQLNVSLIIEGTICNKGTTAVHFKFSRLWFSESLVTVCQLLEKSGRKFQGFFVDYYRINGKKKQAHWINFDLLCCYWCFLSGSVQNRSRGVQTEEAEGGTGLFHVTAGGVLLRPPRCRRCVLDTEGTSRPTSEVHHGTFPHQA